MRKTFCLTEKEIESIGNGNKPKYSVIDAKFKGSYSIGFPRF